MDSRHTSDQQKFKDAGEQAARVIGEFMSLANDFSKRFENGFCDPESVRENRAHDRGVYENTGSASADNSSADRSNTHGYRNTDRANTGWAYADDIADEFRNAGEYLRELREAAGYTVDSFAQAMNRHNAAQKIKSVEAGREVFPNDWLDQISALLKQNDPAEFFDKLRNLYEPDNMHGRKDQHNRDYGESSNDGKPQTAYAVASARREKLNEIFTDETLSSLSDSQFEELSEFIKTNYQAALQLVRNK